MTRQVLRFDDRLGVRMLRSVQTRGRQSGTPYLMRTNAAGFRTRDIEDARPAGRRRILVYGDSFTEGVGVSDGSRYTDVLEKMLPDTEVVNLAIRATGTDQQFLAFRDRPAGLEYDLVVIGLYAGDVLRNHSKYGVLTSATGEIYEKPYFREEGDSLALQNVPVPRVPASYSRLDRSERELVYHRGFKYRLRLIVKDYAPWAKKVLQRVTRYQPAPFLRSADNPAWTLTRAIVRSWAAEAGVPVLVLAIPPYQYVEKTASSRGYRARFSELSTEPGVRVHDPLDDLLRAGSLLGKDRLRLPGDAHYAVEGHRIVAESLLPVVIDLLGIDPSTAADAPGRASA